MLSQLLEQFETDLAGVGVKATSDPRRLAVPGALLYPTLIDFDRLDADVATVPVEVLLIAKGLGTPQALDQLEDLLTKVKQLWTVPTVETVTATLPNHSPDPLPAFRFTLTTQVTSNQE